MNFRKATLSNHIALTELTKRSKAHWDYSAEQMEKWVDELTITKEYIATYEVFKLETKAKEILAYYSYKRLSEEEAELDNFFIDPDHIGQGWGRIMLVDFFRKILMDNIKSIILYSDPHAQGFYEKYGFEVVGQWESSVPNRFLPIMKKHL